MDDLKYTTASNIINLRQKAGMTQSELAALINYSDKSVSKWERAEAVPDAYVLKKMSEIFGVTVDYLLSPHDGWDQDPRQKKPAYSNQVIILLSVTGVWMLALILFICVITGGREEPQPETAEAETTSLTAMAAVMFLMVTV